VPWTFALLTSKSTQFIFVPSCAEVKFVDEILTRGLYDIVLTNFKYMLTHVLSLSYGQPENKMPLAANRQ